MALRRGPSSDWWNTKWQTSALFFCWIVRVLVMNSAPKFGRFLGCFLDSCISCVNPFFSDVYSNTYTGTFIISHPWPLNPREIHLQDEYGNRILDDDGKEIYESFHLRFRFFRTWRLIVEVVVWNEGKVRVMEFFGKKKRMLGKYHGWGKIDDCK